MMLSNCALSIVIVLVSFDLEKGESRLAIAHSEIECRVGGKFLDDKLLERCGQRGGKQGIRLGLAGRARSNPARDRATDR